MKNLAITAKLTGRPEPGLAVKRRVRSSPFAPVRHVADVSRFGSPPKTPPGTYRLLLLTLKDAAQFASNLTQSVSIPTLQLNDRAFQEGRIKVMPRVLVQDDAVQMVELADSTTLGLINITESNFQSVVFAGSHNPLFSVSDSAQQVVASAPSEHEPRIQIVEPARQDVSQVPSEFTPEVRLKDAGQQALALVDTEHVPLVTLEDLSSQTLSLQNGDFRPMVYLGDGATESAAITGSTYAAGFFPLTAYGDFFTTYPDGPAGTLADGTQFSGNWLYTPIPNPDGDHFETYPDGAAGVMGDGLGFSGDWLYS